MKKILLLFTSFLFTSNLILFGADSFGAQADGKLVSLNDSSKRVDELLQQASTLEEQIAKQRQSLKEPSTGTFYQQLKKLWPDVKEHDFVSRVAPLFIDNEISINTPTPSHSKKRAILDTLLSPKTPLDSSPETKQKLNELLGQVTILTNIQEKTAEAERLKEEAKQEAARLKREAKQEAARLKKEEEARRKAQKQEAAEKARLEEKRRQAEVLQRVLAPTPGAGDLVSERQKKQNLQAAIRGQKQEEHRAQVEERNRREMDDYLENLRKQYRGLSPSGREKLKDTFKDNQDVQTFFGRLDAQLALEAEEQRLVAEYERIEQLKQEIIEQERLALLEHYRTNLASFIFHCSKYIRENPKLTDQARQSLENLIASLQRKIETSGQLTKAHFLAMEQNSLLAEAVSVMEELPEIKDHFDTANSMWNSILEGYKNPIK